MEQIPGRCTNPVSKYVAVSPPLNLNAVLHQPLTPWVGGGPAELWHDGEPRDCLRMPQIASDCLRMPQIASSWVWTTDRDFTETCPRSRLLRKLLSPLRCRRSTSPLLQRRSRCASPRTPGTQRATGHTLEKRPMPVTSQKQKDQKGAFAGPSEVRPEDCKAKVHILYQSVEERVRVGPERALGVLASPSAHNANTSRPKASRNLQKTVQLVNESRAPRQIELKIPKIPKSFAGFAQDLHRALPHHSGDWKLGVAFQSGGSVMPFSYTNASSMRGSR